MLFPLCIPPPTSVCPSSSFVTMTPSPSRESLLAIFPVGNLCLGESFLSGFGAFLCLTPTSQHLMQPCRHPRAPSSSACSISAHPPPGVVLPSLCSLRRRTKVSLVLGTGAGVGRDPSAPGSPGDAGCGSLPELSGATGCPTTRSSIENRICRREGTC